MKFEHQGRRRLTQKGSKASKNLTLDVDDLATGEGRLLPTGEIVINHPDQGVIVLRADHVHVYTPVVESLNPLDSILGCKAESDDDEETDIDAEQTKPLLDADALKHSGPLGTVTGGDGFGGGY